MLKDYQPTENSLRNAKKYQNNERSQINENNLMGDNLKLAECRIPLNIYNDCHRCRRWQSCFKIKLKINSVVERF